MQVPASASGVEDVDPIFTQALVTPRRQRCLEFKAQARAEPADPCGWAARAMESPDIAPGDAVQLHRPDRVRPTVLLVPGGQPDRSTGVGRYRLPVVIGRSHLGYS